MFFKNHGTNSYFSNLKFEPQVYKIQLPASFGVCDLLIDTSIDNEVNISHKPSIVINGITFGLRWGQGYSLDNKHTFQDIMERCGIAMEPHEFNDFLIKACPMIEISYNRQEMELVCYRIHGHAVSGQGYLHRSMKTVLNSGLPVDVITLANIQHSRTRKLLSSAITSTGGVDNFLKEAMGDHPRYCSSTLLRSLIDLGYKRVEIAKVMAGSLETGDFEVKAYPSDEVSFFIK